jgi:hypothetical protein
MLRFLLTFVGVVLVIVCVALLGLWVRSYYNTDSLNGIFTDRCGFQLMSSRGDVSFCMTSLAKPWPRKVTVDLTDNFSKRLLPYPDGDTDDDTAETWMRQRVASMPSSSPPDDPGGWLFNVRSIGSGDSFIRVPDWFAVLSTGVAAWQLLRKPSWQFTIRTMFAATTLLAVVLGLAAWMFRL